MKENKNKGKIDGKLIKESLLDYNNLATQLKESTPDIVKNLLAEQVKQAYASILNESEEDDEDYDVEEVDDTDAEEIGDVEGTEEADDEPIGDEVTDGTSDDGMEPDDEADTEDDATEEEDVDAEVEPDETDGDEEDMISQDIEKYKTAGNEYDLRELEGNDIVKIYKLLKDDDTVKVVKDSDNLQISDDETGAEYIIKLGDDNTSDELEDDNFNADDNMNESTIYEIALNEYDSHVGITDKYQDKDVMTSDGVKEPSKFGRDIDKGVPQNTQKPWSKVKKNAAPFNKGVKNECGVTDKAPEVDESIIGAKHGHTAKGMVKFHDTNSGDEKKNPYNKKVVSVAGEYKGNQTPTNEAIIKKAKKIFAENKALKAELSNFEKTLTEAAVVNVNLGGIIKLISENATSMDEKKEIINRFTKEAHTVNESRQLYERIADELRKKPSVKADINEEKQFGTQKTINESKFYQDETLMDSLGLMHRICK